MAKFRKKPGVIEAEQYTHAGKWVQGMCSDDNCFVAHSPHVHTIHQNQPVHVLIGDWIIPELDGIHFYPCKQDIFEATYERVVETPPGPGKEPPKLPEDKQFR